LPATPPSCISHPAQDLSYTARVLRRAPGFACTAIAIVALASGATTAAFSAPTSC